MTWLNPNGLLLLLLVIPMTLLVVWRSWRNRARRIQFADPSRHAELFPGEQSGNFSLARTIRYLLLLAGMTGAVLAWARPTWGFELQPVAPSGTDIMILLDLSKSMLAGDIKPTRLERAKAEIDDLVNQASSQRIGLIGFAGEAILLAPLTVDRNFLRQVVNEATPSTMPIGGSKIGVALERAIEALSHEKQNQQTIVLFTDGDNQDELINNATAKLQANKIKVIAIGLGDETSGSTINLTGDADEPVFVRDQLGKVVSKMNPSLLRSIADSTGGKFIDVRQHTTLLDTYKKLLFADESTTDEVAYRSVPFEQFQWPLLLAILCFTWERWQMLRERRLPASASRRLVSMLILLLLLVFSPTLQAQTAPTDKEQELDPKKLYHAALVELSKEEFDASRFHLEQALALSDRPDLSARAWYALGSLSIKQLTQRWPAIEQPEQLSSLVDPNERDQIRSLLAAATGCFRDCLALDPSFQPARRSIDLARSWQARADRLWWLTDHHQEYAKLGWNEYLLRLARAPMKLNAELARRKESLASSVSTASALLEPDEFANHALLLEREWNFSLQRAMLEFKPTITKQLSDAEAIMLRESEALAEIEARTRRGELNLTWPTTTTDSYLAKLIDHTFAFRACIAECLAIQQLLLNTTTQWKQQSNIAPPQSEKTSLLDEEELFAILLKASENRLAGQNPWPAAKPSNTKAPAQSKEFIDRANQNIARINVLRQEIAQKRSQGHWTNHQDEQREIIKLLRQLLEEDQPANQNSKSKEPPPKEPPPSQQSEPPKNNQDQPPNSDKPQDQQSTDANSKSSDQPEQSKSEQKESTPKDKSSSNAEQKERQDGKPQSKPDENQPVERKNKDAKQPKDQTQKKDPQSPDTPKKQPEQKKQGEQKGRSRKEQAEPKKSQPGKQDRKPDEKQDGKSDDASGKQKGEPKAGESASQKKGGESTEGEQSAEKKSQPTNKAVAQTKDDAQDDPMPEVKKKEQQSDPSADDPKQAQSASDSQAGMGDASNRAPQSVRTDPRGVTIDVRSSVEAERIFERLRAREQEFRADKRRAKFGRRQRVEKDW